MAALCDRLPGVIGPLLPDSHPDFALATLVGARLGEDYAFGTSPGMAP